MDKNCPKKLNLNAPFLSTRRTNGAPATLEIPGANPQGACNRVPFSWEECPGKPKDTENITINDIIGGVLPRPKPPPGRRPPPIEPINGESHGHDEGCDGDVDDEYDSFSDAIDMFSLSEAIDFVEAPVNYSFDEASGSQSPSFIIQRFLQDAKALAVASSALTIPKDSEKCGAYTSSPKGCGLEILLPWRVKHKPCAMKSPVKEMPLKLKPKLGVREKQMNGSTLEENSWRRRGGAND